MYLSTTAFLLIFLVKWIILNHLQLTWLHCTWGTLRLVPKRWQLRRNKTTLTCRLMMVPNLLKCSLSLLMLLSSAGICQTRSLVFWGNGALLLKPWWFGLLKFGLHRGGRGIHYLVMKMWMHPCLSNYLEQYRMAFITMQKQVPYFANQGFLLGRPTSWPPASRFLESDSITILMLLFGILSGWPNNSIN